MEGVGKGGRRRGEDDRRFREKGMRREDNRMEGVSVF